MPSPLLSRLFNRDVKGLVKFFSRLQGGAYTPDVRHSSLYPLKSMGGLTDDLI